METLFIDHESRKPKYKQLVDSILDNIATGRFTFGQKIPSINELSESYLLSRDTVEKSYSLLKEKKIISSVKGKGFYITNTNIENSKKILFLVNKLSNYKLRIFNSFVNTIGHYGKVDLDIYHCDSKLFVDILKTKKDNYDFIIVMSHFKDPDLNYCALTENAIKVLNTIPKKKLLVLDSHIKNSYQMAGAVYQDFANDQYESLTKNLTKIKYYQKIILVFPTKILYPYPDDIRLSFENFCIVNNLNYELLPEIYEGMELHSKDLYITIEESDLVNLIKQIRESKFEIGKDVGIISYNETPLKELLGISVLSTNFKKMGDLAANMILENKYSIIRNPFNFIIRDSLY